MRQNLWMFATFGLVGAFIGGAISEALYSIDSVGWQKNTDGFWNHWLAKQASFTQGAVLGSIAGVVIATCYLLYVLYIRSDKL